MKVGFILLKCPNTVQIQNMKMDIEVKASTKTLDKPKYSAYDHIVFWTCLFPPDS